MTLTAQHGAMEVSMHQCGDVFARDGDGPTRQALGELLCVPTMQHAREDLVKVGVNIKWRRTASGEFHGVRERVCALIEAKDILQIT